MKFPFFNSIPVEITQVNIAYNTAMHSFGGMKAKKKFVYKLPFSNTETVPMRVLKIEVSAPFVLKKMNYSLPADVESGQKMVFELRCEFDGKFAYSGPMNIKLNALPISSRLAKK
ncbi:MAG: hypothetical protein KGH49_00520 [Candidatus Micrarchaeota archaeon]|nr:hypothetical protein [Candidatus Micrarchaeota archaeon]